MIDTDIMNILIITIHPQSSFQIIIIYQSTSHHIYVHTFYHHFFASFPPILPSGVNPSPLPPKELPPIDPKGLPLASHGAFNPY